MILDYEEIKQLLGELKKQFNLAGTATLEELNKKIENNNIYYTVECTEIDILSPSVKSAFFLKNCSIIIDDCIDCGPKFDKTMIVDTKLIKKNKVLLVDINGNKLELNKNNVKIKSKTIPIDLFMNIMQ